MDNAGIHYRYVPLHQLSLHDAETSLTARERGDLAGLRDSHRRATWLAGRLVTKQLVADWLARHGDDRVPLTDLKITSLDSFGRKSRPTASRAGQPLRCTLSLAHTRTAVLAALAPANVSLGVDLTPRHEHLGRGFAELWFTGRERSEFIGQHSPGLAAAWAIKEAAYKALNRGEPFEPRQWCVEAGPHGEWICHRAGDQSTSNCHLTLWNTAQNELAVLATAPNGSLNQPLGARS